MTGIDINPLEEQRSFLRQPFETQKVPSKSEQRAVQEFVAGDQEAVNIRESAQRLVRRRGKPMSRVSVIHNPQMGFSMFAKSSATRNADTV